jgi:hypothetical protein
MGMGIGARSQGRFDLAKRHLEEGLRVFKQIGHKGMMAVMTSEIAHTQRAQGAYVQAKKTYQETIKVFQDYGNLPAVAHQLECFAMIAVVEEEPQRAAKLFSAAEGLRQVTGHTRTDEEEKVILHPKTLADGLFAQIFPQYLAIQELHKAKNPDFAFIYETTVKLDRTTARVGLAANFS